MKIQDTKFYKRKIVYKYALILIFFGVFGLAQNSKAANIYVDKTNITNGVTGHGATWNGTNGTNYDPNKAGSPGAGKGYKTVQGAVNVVTAGDTIYMRGGTYGSADLNATAVADHVVIPQGKQGTAQNPIRMMSYPGEWAILDGEYAKNGLEYTNQWDSTITYNAGDGVAWLGFTWVSLQNNNIGVYINGENPNEPALGSSWWYPFGPAVIAYRKGGQSNGPAYWIFSRFEVKRGGKTDYKCLGGGISLRTSFHNTFEYLYIHDNIGSGYENDGGISLQQDPEAPQYNTIQYCYLKDNGDPANINTGNIVLFGDYANPPNITIANARIGNEIKYNLIVGGYKGIKNKNDQFLTNDHTGANTTYEDYGDKIHHNIILDFLGKGIECRQDFQQIYNNIISSSLATNGKLGILVGCNETNEDREPFHVVAYNNTIIGNSLTWMNQDNDLYGPTKTPRENYHPYAYAYNNILESYGTDTGTNADDSILKMDLNIMAGHAADTIDEACVNWSTVHIGNNLFWPRSTSDGCIYSCIVGNPYTPASLVSAGRATNLWANSTAGLHPGSSGADKYKTVGTFDLDGVSGNKTIADGGIGVTSNNDHPYLNGVKIPSYIGAVNPSSDAWVQGVLNLATYTNLRDAGSGDPSWIEGSSQLEDTIAPASPSGLSVS